MTIHILEIIEIEYGDEENAEVIPFLFIEQKPIFPGCENLSKEESYICFQKGVMNHISENLQVPSYTQRKWCF